MRALTDSATLTALSDFETHPGVGGGGEASWAEWGGGRRSTPHFTFLR